MNSPLQVTTIATNRVSGTKTLPKPTPLSPTALRTRWALQDLASTKVESGTSGGRRPTSGVQAMGLHFPSPLGLAAGFDRSGVLIGRACRLGLGSVEIGSVSAGSRDLARTLQGLRRSRAPGAILGISVVKRPATPWPRAPGELLAVLHQVHGLADYLALNPGRDCPDPALFAALFGELARERDRLADRGGQMPLVAKLPACWLASTDPAALAQRFAAQGADGIMLASDGHPGLDPLDLLRCVSAAVGPEICLISVGGVTKPQELRQRLQAGASLVQVHGALRRSNCRQWINKAVGAASGRELQLAKKRSRPEAAPTLPSPPPRQFPLRTGVLP